MKIIKSLVSKFFRSISPVRSIAGRDTISTVQAYTVIISPVSAVCISKLVAISLNIATGTNSVVLKINPANAINRTRHD